MAVETPPKDDEFRTVRCKRLEIVDDNEDIRLTLDTLVADNRPLILMESPKAKSKIMVHFDTSGIPIITMSVGDVYPESRLAIHTNGGYKECEAHEVLDLQSLATVRSVVEV